MKKNGKMTKLFTKITKKTVNSNKTPVFWVPIYKVQYKDKQYLIMCTKSSRILKAFKLLWLSQSKYNSSLHGANKCH